MKKLIQKVFEQRLLVGGRVWEFKWWVINHTIRPVQNFIDWIVKSCQYAWFLRKDYDWDFTYLLELMHFKMDRMQKNMDKYGHHTTSRDTAREIRDCMRVLDRLIEDDYMLTEMKILLDKRPLLEDINDQIELANGRKVRRTRSFSEQEQAEFKAYSDKEDALRKADEKLFFNSFRKQFRGWWH